MSQLIENPFNAVLKETNNSSVHLQALYHMHRATRNAEQKALILDSSFSGWHLDPILMKLEGPSFDPSYVDPRNNAIIWARPTRSILDLIEMIQRSLFKYASDLWLVPKENLHMTALEIGTCLTVAELKEIHVSLKEMLPQIIDYTLSHRTRLVKPLISYDRSGLALTFVPAAATTDTPITIFGVISMI
ncbi:hypothetical protein N7462_003220 [Penicillium macrosclerotiorum]|uniref:uncharacterized protein n=1 Tax=Penicillium macrosclerotiorum TaxID=303699 RepID=UPI0025488F8F|nr:uncharacterized protein N7462_003220 [Penicillium macrosclerotiorum]KAJ5688828.1 hypothetical protein N7462_003220 [Penicillium macrosclerotiorum]